DGPVGVPAGDEPPRRGRRDPRVPGPGPGLSRRDVRALRGGARDHVPGPAGGGLAAAAPGLRPRVRRDPEARAGGRVPADLAGTPNVEGLYFASEPFRSRGIGVDRAARAALTVVEDYLGRRLPGFESTWRY